MVPTEQFYGRTCNGELAEVKERKMYKMLILDDELLHTALNSCVGKGYPDIEHWYPGIFQITTCGRMGSWQPEHGPYGLKLLKEEKWDIILLDACFDPPDGAEGHHALREIRKDGHLNEKTYVIGCSNGGWRDTWFNSPKYLQGNSEKPEELWRCLAEFLARQSQT